MKTQAFSVWTELVEEFTQSIAPESSKKKIERWLEKSGEHFFNGERDFFNRFKSEYAEVASPCSSEAFQLRMRQIDAGFDGWLNDLLAAFPDLANDSTIALYLRFISKIKNHTEFYPFIAAKAVICVQHAKENSSEDIITYESKAMQKLKSAIDKSGVDFLSDKEMKQNEPSRKSVNFFHRKELVEDPQGWHVLRK